MPVIIYRLRRQLSIKQRCNNCRDSSLYVCSNMKITISESGSIALSVFENTGHPYDLVPEHNGLIQYQACCIRRKVREFSKLFWNKVSITTREIRTLNFAADTGLQCDVVSWVLPFSGTMKWTVCIIPTFWISDGFYSRILILVKRTQ